MDDEQRVVTNKATSATLEEPTPAKRRNPREQLEQAHELRRAAHYDEAITLYEESAHTTALMDEALEGVRNTFREATGALIDRLVADHPDVLVALQHRWMHALANYEYRLAFTELSAYLADQRPSISGVNMSLRMMRLRAAIGLAEYESVSAALEEDFFLLWHWLDGDRARGHLLSEFFAITRPSFLPLFEKLADDVILPGSVRAAFRTHAETLRALAATPIASLDERLDER